MQYVLEVLQIIVPKHAPRAQHFEHNQSSWDPSASKSLTQHNLFTSIGYIAPLDSDAASSSSREAYLIMVYVLGIHV